MRAVFPARTASLRLQRFLSDCIRRKERVTLRPLDEGCVDVGRLQDLARAKGLELVAQRLQVVKTFHQNSGEWRTLKSLNHFGAATR